MTTQTQPQTKSPKEQTALIDYAQLANAVVEEMEVRHR